MNKSELAAKAAQLRRDLARMIGPGVPGHLGGAASIMDVVTWLYYEEMANRPEDPAWPDRDRLIFSKGHSGVAQYVALADRGYFPKEELGTLKQLGSRLQGHPDMHRLPGIEMSTGSLGQGLSVACGMAAGMKLDGLPGRVFAVVGDWELAEGQIWEAAMAASNFCLDNLVVILDNNEIQATDWVNRTFDTHPYPQKWAAFGFHVIELDGHDFDAIEAAFAGARANRGSGRPTVLIAHTHKGQGFPFALDTAAFHNGTMTPEQYAVATGEVQA